MIVDGVAETEVIVCVAAVAVVPAVCEPVEGSVLLRNLADVWPFCRDLNLQYCLIGANVIPPGTNATVGSTDDTPAEVEIVIQEAVS